ncbi:hypothetical protein PCK1_000872 [Pneumocystis canis]|nr:hypothetical protein PCK1_000872 [Pneumocystis canis]
MSENTIVSQEKLFSETFPVKHYPADLKMVPAAIVARLHNELESEQEAITNTFLRRLDQLKYDKIRIESELEIESENIVNRLTRELNKLRTAENYCFGPLRSPKQSPIISPTNFIISTQSTFPDKDFPSDTETQISSSNSALVNVSNLTKEMTPNLNIIETLKADNILLRDQLKMLNIQYINLKLEKDTLKKKLDEICKIHNISINDVM